MRDTLEAWIAEGGNAAFFSGNAVAPRRTAALHCARRASAGLRRWSATGLLASAPGGPRGDLRRYRRARLHLLEAVVTTAALG
jgi:hypothetical protein